MVSGPYIRRALVLVLLVCLGLFAVTYLTHGGLHQSGDEQRLVRFYFVETIFFKLYKTDICKRQTM